MAAASSPDGEDSPIRVLVVDDDATMNQLITTYLLDQNILVDSTANRADTMAALTAHRFDLVVLDLRLGKDNGLDLLREIRARSDDTPVIIITGHGRDEVDRVVGLELGADDYLTKPFGLRELLARIRAVLRRREAAPAAARAPAERFRFGGWLLDQRSRLLTGPDGLSADLTKGEYALLVAFLEAPQRPLSREQLLQATRVHEDVFDRSIDVKILRLRRKLGDATGDPGIIQTRRGVGYVFTLPVRRE